MVINATNLVVRKKYDNTNFLILLGRIQMFSNIQNRGGNNNRPLVFMGDWFQDLLQIPNSADALVP